VPQINRALAQRLVGFQHHLGHFMGRRMREGIDEQHMTLHFLRRPMFATPAYDLLRIGHRAARRLGNSNHFFAIRDYIAGWAKGQSHGVL
jgi:hypothetical protein